jgi:hypothetical protein
VHLPSTVQNVGSLSLRRGGEIKASMTFCEAGHT